MKYISKLLVKWLLKLGAISTEKEELYEFAIYSFLFSSFPLIVVICIGATLNMMLEGILMILPFMFIRKFSGGFHLKSPIICTISSILLLSLLLLGINLTLNQNIVFFSSIVMFLAAFIFKMSPIDSEERRLSSKEKKVFRKFCRVILTFFVLIYILLLFVKMERWAISIGYGIIFTGLLQLPCIVYRHQF